MLLWDSKALLLSPSFDVFSAGLVCHSHTQETGPWTCAPSFAIGSEIVWQKYNPLYISPAQTLNHAWKLRRWGWIHDPGLSTGVRRWTERDSIVFKIFILPSRLDHGYSFSTKPVFQSWCKNEILYLYLEIGRCECRSKYHSINIHSCCLLLASYKTTTHLTAAGSQGPRKNPILGSWVGTSSVTTDTSGASLLNMTSIVVHFMHESGGKSFCLKIVIMII